MRGLENFNSTMENLNETAARVNRLLNDFEEPIRAMLPQLTRTVKMADDLSMRLATPIDQVVPGLTPAGRDAELAGDAVACRPTSGSSWRSSTTSAGGCHRSPRWPSRPAACSGCASPASARASRRRPSPRPRRPIRRPRPARRGRRRRRAPVQRPRRRPGRPRPGRRRPRRPRRRSGPPTSAPAKKAAAKKRVRAKPSPNLRQSAAQTPARQDADERGGDDGAGQGGAADVDRHRRPVDDRRRDEAEGDAVAEHRGEVAARDLADEHRRRRRSRTRRGAAAGPRWRCPTRCRRTPASRSASRASRPAELRLAPRHDPAQTGLQRRDARAELVAVQRQAGLQPQRVAGAEPGRSHAGADDGVPQRRLRRRPGRRSRHPARPCSRCRRRCSRRRSTSAWATRNRPTAAAAGNTGRQPVPRRRALDGEHGPSSRSSRSPPTASRTRSVFEALGITSNTSSTPSGRGCHQTMMSSSTEPSASSSRWVYWARPGPTLPRSLDSVRCSRSRASGPADLHRAEVRDVEHDGVLAGRRGARRSCPSGTPAACPTRRTAPCGPRRRGGRRRAASARGSYGAARRAGSAPALVGERHELGVDVVLDAGQRAAR